ncbi:putative uncharacterized protein [Candidatus Glomeribacter gigasporarum BEG34]|uniref:EfeO-type cupredoxin-like domain-containing protein n=1 Tax=Candidatus Glomeribacter gigasporarum BEG34 TaxID=1070319 RepID=G2JBI1_9BURK|nr:cupredoxin domain-containing protein [Candidatus Glomeribacter gigasporarum]CCD30135.1 putative uncharacterized protein [Candidatus Glomeribacter gigasporarum BEG34]
MKLCQITADGIAALLFLMAVSAHAKALPALKLEMKDGRLTPARIEAPAGQRIKIEITNAGGSAAEFESIPLRKEKVVAPGVTTFVVIKALAPGEYPFFDDFHPKTAQGVIVAK